MPSVAFAYRPASRSNPNDQPADWLEGLLSALCGRLLTTLRLAEVAPKPTPMITLTNDEVG